MKYKQRDTHDYSFRPAPFAADLGAPYLVTVTCSDDPSGEPVAELPYPQALEQYGDALWPEVMTCGTCYARYPDITPSGRCPFEGDHPDPDDDDDDEDDEEDESAFARPLYKTTVVIWSEFCGADMRLSALAAQADGGGDAICTRYGSKLVANPAADAAWDPDAAEFFSGDDGENGEEEDDADD